MTDLVDETKPKAMIDLGRYVEYSAIHPRDACAAAASAALI